MVKIMRNTIAIENIERMRLQEGIDDVELKKEIRGLKVGDFVKLTLLTGMTTFETALVRIVSIRGLTYTGELTDKPAANSLSEARAGLPLDFMAAHIHSIPKQPPANG
jgi:hypothetical protein